MSVRSLSDIQAVVALLFVFAELVAEQRLDIEQSLFGISSSGIHLNRNAQAGSKHHDAHYALGIDALSSAGNENIAAEPAGQLGELGRRAGVQAQLVANYDVDGRHRVHFGLTACTADWESACLIGIDDAS